MPAPPRIAAIACRWSTTPARLWHSKASTICTERASCTTSLRSAQRCACWQDRPASSGVCRGTPAVSTIKMPACGRPRPDRSRRDEDEDEGAHGRRRMDPTPAKIKSLGVCVRSCSWKSFSCPTSIRACGSTTTWPSDGREGAAAGAARQQAWCWAGKGGNCADARTGCTGHPDGQGRRWRWTIRERHVGSVVYSTSLSVAVAFWGASDRGGG